MKLVEVKIKNFRCYNEERSFEVDDFICLVGRNDAGKSAFFEALDIFFNASKPDFGDNCIENTDCELDITCVFSELPDEIILDKTAKTTLEAEYLLRKDGFLEISKRYNYQPDSETVKLTGMYVNCDYPEGDEIDDLHGLTQNQLKSLAKQHCSKLDDIDKRKNSELRRAIWDSLAPFTLKRRSISLEKERKDHWTQLKGHLPVYSLFKADRANNNADSEIQDPLKTAIKEATKKVEAQIEEIKRLVTNRLDEVATATLDKVRELDETLAKELHAKIEAKDSSTLFSANIYSDRGIPLDKRGTGIRRLILLSFFRANLEARLKELNATSVIYAIEEPETGQHPSHQRMILKHLQELSWGNSVQVFVTTHSPAIAKTVDTRSIRFLKKQPPLSPILFGGNDTEVHKEIIQELGIFPAHGVKLFLGLEGGNDINMFRNLSASLADEGVDGVIDFANLEASGKLIIVPQGGSNLALSSSNLHRIRIPEYHIFDRDSPPTEPPHYEDEANEIISRGGQAFHLSRRELENFFPVQSIVDVYARNGININIPTQFSEFDDVPQMVAELLHNASDSQMTWENLCERKQKHKVKNVKSTLGQHLIVSREDLRQIDATEEILTRIQEICSACAD